jgi:hypothetical protein
MSDRPKSAATTTSQFSELLDNLLSATRHVGRLESEVVRLEADLVLARRHASSNGDEQRHRIEDALDQYRAELRDSDRQIVLARNVVRSYLRAT